MVLVGHSYGGFVVSGVAERLPGRIKSIVFLDAFVPDNGNVAARHWPGDAQADQRGGGHERREDRAAASRPRSSR